MPAGDASTRVHLVPQHCVGPAAAAAVLPPVWTVPPSDRLLLEARAHAARGDLGQALARLDDALAREPGLDVARYCRALCLLGLDREPEAERELRALGPRLAGIPSLRDHPVVLQEMGEA